MAYSPPFQLTHKMMSLVAAISQLIGQWTAGNQHNLVPELRRENRIRTIQASLAVEQNTLSLEQVTALIEGKIVLGTPKEIQEVHNAFAAYDAMVNCLPHQSRDLLATHGVLMQGLVKDAGQWRNGGAGIYRGDRLLHMAPPASQVPRLMTQLLDWLAKSDAHPLIASTAFHYEFEFIHPFSDGNGRMGRLWQTLILSQWHPLLAFLPVETVIKARQQDYYQALSQADARCDCTAFIEFLLGAIECALQEAIAAEGQARVEMKVETRVEMKVETAKQILALLYEQPELTLADVAAQIGRSVSTIERAVAKLKRQGRLSYHGPRKGGYWQVEDE